MLNYNYEMAIVKVIKGGIPNIYDFLRAEESKEDALKRGEKVRLQNLAAYEDNHKKYPFDEGGHEYWQTMYEKEQNTEYVVMPTENFLTFERKCILEMPLAEISEEVYEEALNVLPPLSYVNHGGVIMFCMREFYTGSYTMQYAKTEGHFFRKYVDYKDKSTWICEVLKSSEKTEMTA